MIRAQRLSDTWTVVGVGADVDVAAAFVGALSTAGRSSYTQRSYAMGLAVFLRWLDLEALTLRDVNRAVIVRYTRALTSGAQPLSPA